VGQREARLVFLERRTGELESALASERAALASLKERYAELENRLSAGEARERALSENLEDAARESDRLRGELEQWATSAAREREDDLKLIRGIGPTFERGLKALGIRTFEQIAEWTDTDILDVAAKIRTRPERIRREAWVPTARALSDSPTDR
jgi:predicted flap endonuclease-1-like 5' DNA nuclease